MKKILFAFLIIIVAWITTVTCVLFFSEHIIEDEMLIKSITLNEKKGHRLPCQDMLYIGDLPYITKYAAYPFPNFIFKYRISGIGVVPCWSKSSKLLDSFFDSKENPSNQSDEDKLGLKN